MNRPYKMNIFVNYMQEAVMFWHGCETINKTSYL